MIATLGFPPFGHLPWELRSSLFAPINRGLKTPSTSSFFARRSSWELRSVKRRRIFGSRTPEFLPRLSFFLGFVDLGDVSASADA